MQPGGIRRFMDIDSDLRRLSSAELLLLLYHIWVELDNRVNFQPEASATPAPTNLSCLMAVTSTVTGAVGGAPGTKPDIDITPALGAGNGSVDNRNPERDGNVEEELDRSLGDVDLPSDIQDGSFSDDLGLYSGSAASRFNIDDPELDGRSANCQITMACVNPLLACSRPVTCCCELHTGGSHLCAFFPAKADGTRRCRAACCGPQMGGLCWSFPRRMQRFSAVSFSLWERLVLSIFRQGSLNTEQASERLAEMARIFSMLWGSPVFLIT